MNRLLEIAPEDRTPDQTEAFDRVAAGRGNIPTPYKVWIHSPQLALGMEQVGTFLNKRSSLTRRELEICILLIANHWEGEYVLTNHKRGAKKAGFDDATIDMMLRGERPALPDAREQAVYDLATAAISRAKPSDEDYARYAEALGRNGVAETLAAIGYYGSVAMAMKLHDVPLLEKD